MRYSAFISYNHRDRGWAEWLHRALESYRVPKRLRGREGPFGAIGARLPPVFRDRDELAAAAGLGDAVRAALDESANLIVILSPSGAQSRWVEAEVRHFIDGGRRDRIRCVIIDGEPNADDPARECLPPSLRTAPGEEPLAADPRANGDGKRGARLKLIAGLLDLPYDELRQREAARRQKQLTAIAVGASAGLVLTSGLAVAALVARNEAVEQRTLADQRATTAERTVGFVKSMFEDADPSNARGADITVREVLDRGARRLPFELAREPAVRTELALTLGEVYASVGLMRQGGAMIRETFSVPHKQSAIEARQWRALGEAHYAAGRYKGAIAAFDRALAVAAKDPSLPPSARSRALFGLGQARFAIEDDAGARAALEQALRIDLAAKPRVFSDIALDLEGLGLNEYYAGRDAQARPFIRRALAIRMRTEGPMSPSVADNLNTLASIAHRGGDPATAEALWRRNLAIDEKVLGPDHPDLGLTLNNLARVLIERRAFAEAEPMLDRARRLIAAQRGAAHDDLAFVEMNLGIARRGLGRRDAIDTLRRGEAIARRSGHPSLGAILGEIADLRCSARETAESAAMLDEATRAVDEAFGPDDWRMAWLADVRAGCLKAAGRATEANALFADSGVKMAKRWNPGSRYAVDMAGRRAR